MQPNTTKKNRAWQFFLLQLCCPLIMFAQKAEVKVQKFLVIDSISRTALPGISVLVFNKKTNKISYNTVSDNNGQCFVEREYLNDTSSLIFFTAVGYKEYQMTGSFLMNRTLSVEIQLAPVPTVLNEVRVISNPNIVTIKGNRLEFDINGLPNAKNMITSDMLDNLPFMRVEDGKVKMMNEPLTILINGKPHSFYNSIQNLNSLPTAAIELIIVDLAASAQYGQKVINIVLKKNYFLGWNGNFNINVSRLGLGSSGQVSYWQNKWGINIATTLNSSKNRGKNDSRLESYTNKSLVLQQGRTVTDYTITTLFASLFYNPDSLTTIDLEYSYSPKRVSSLANSDISKTDSQMQTSFQKSTLRKNDKTGGSSIGLNYTKNYRKQGKQFYLLSQYFSSEEKNLNDFTRQTSTSTLQSELISNLNNFREVTAEAGYKTNNKKLRHHSGAKIVHRTYSSDIFSTDRTFPPDTTSVFFKYRQVVITAYTQADLTINKIVLHLGLRFDHEDFTYLTPVSINNTYNNFFPNLSITYNLNKQNVLVASYSQSVYRPFAQSLVSFSYANSAYVRDSGSAQLKPQYGSSYDLQIYGNYKFGRLGLNVTYSSINNYLNDYYIQYADGSIARFDINASYNRSYTVGTSAEIPLSKKISFSHFCSGSLVVQKGYGLRPKQVSGYLSERINYRINQKQRISISALAFSPNFSLQSKSQGMAYVKTTINYSYFAMVFKKFPVSFSGTLSTPWLYNGLPGYTETKDNAFYYYEQRKSANPIIGLQMVITFKGKQFFDKSFQRTESIQNIDIKR